MATLIISPTQVALSVASLSAGFMVVAVALLLYLQHRHKAMLHYATFMGFALFVGGVSFMGRMRVPITSYLLQMTMGALVVPIIAGLSISLACFVFSLLELEPPRLIRWLIWLPAPAALVALGIQIASLHQGGGQLGRFTNQLAILGFYWFFLEWVACSILIGVCFRRITQREVRQGIVGMALVMAAFLAYWVFEVLTHRLLMSPYIVGLAWSALSLVLAARHFFLPVPTPMESPATAGPLADAAMLDRFAELRKLTPRERELCGLLVEGLNHAAIAQRLFISEKTVRNHVSNIYAKVGVTSRLELIQAIRGS